MADNTNHSIREEESRKYLEKIFKDPVIFCEVILHVDFTGREYQKDILRTASIRKVIRMGRRMGKSTTMAMFAIWYAVTHPRHRVIFMSPYMTQIDNIWREIANFIDKSEVVKTRFLKGKVKTKPYYVDFVHGAKISGFSANVKGGGGATNIRGQGAQVILLDEADYLDDESIETIIALLLDSPDVVIWAGSTVSDRRGPFYKWCQIGIKNREMKQRIEAGIPDPDDKMPEHDDWVEFHLPSTKGPFWNEKVEKELRETMSDDAFRREVLVEFGDESEGVFKGKFLNEMRRSKEASYHYDDILPKDLPRGAVVAIGVDWDKYQAGVNIVVAAKIGRKVKVIHREEVSKQEFTLTYGVQKIIELNKKYDPKYIYVDRGYGEAQVEQLKLYGMKYPETKLTERVQGIVFHGTIPVKDVFTGKVIKKQVKHFMVNATQNYLENGRLLFSKHDEELYKQMNEYMVIKHTMQGEPIYTSTREHALDALMLTILAFRTKEDNEDIEVNIEPTTVKKVETHDNSPLLGISRYSRGNQEAINPSRHVDVSKPKKSKAIFFE